MEIINYDWLKRTRLLIGEENLKTLQSSCVAVFGIGGVGGFVCEALARCGVGSIDLFDGDIIALSNLNRQIIALHSTVGKAKVDVMRQRILDINPNCTVVANKVFYSAENADLYPLNKYDYNIDAIDNISAKIELILRAKAANVPIISSMGTGNRLSSENFSITDISKTSGCPLAKKIRRELKTLSIYNLKVLCSNDTPIKINNADMESHLVGSIAYVPSVAGLMIAGEVIKDLCGLNPR